MWLEKERNNLNVYQQGNDLINMTYMWNIRQLFLNTFLYIDKKLLQIATSHICVIPFFKTNPN